IDENCTFSTGSVCGDADRAHSGLALIGLLLSHTRIAKRLIRSSLPGMHQPTVTHPDVVYAYLGLLCQGKSDFDQIEPFRRVKLPFLQYYHVDGDIRFVIGQGQVTGVHYRGGDWATDQ
ncbi:hypothetical protein ABTW76_22375, partial [Paenibacillus dendritiformis]